MDFIDSIKATSEDIINFKEQIKQKVRTWNEEASAPEGGFTDRAGFLYYDDRLEFYADIYAPAETEQGMLRTRLAQIDIDKSGEELFTMIALDFNTPLEKTRQLIANSDSLSAADLNELLQGPETQTKIILVSHSATSMNSDGPKKGKRLTYTIEQLANMSQDEQKDFLSILTDAYHKITNRLSNCYYIGAWLAINYGQASG